MTRGPRDFQKALPRPEESPWPWCVGERQGAPEPLLLPAEGPPPWAQGLRGQPPPARLPLWDWPPSSTPGPWLQLLPALLNRAGFCLRGKRVRVLVRGRARPACLPALGGVGSEEGTYLRELYLMDIKCQEPDMESVLSEWLLVPVAKLLQAPLCREGNRGGRMAGTCPRSCRISDGVEEGGPLKPQTSRAV